MGGGVAASFRTGLPNSDFRVDIVKASAARGVLGVALIGVGFPGVAALAGDSRALSRLGERLLDSLLEGCGVANRCGVSVEAAAAGHWTAAVADSGTLPRSFFARGCGYRVENDFVSAM